MEPPATPMQAFVAPAQAAPQVWRLVVGLILAVTLWIVATLLLTMAGVALGGGPRLALLLALYGFGGLGAGVWLAARLIHRRRPARLAGPDGVRWRQMAAGAGVVAAATAIAALLPDLGLPAAQPQVGLAAWAAWLPLTIPAVAVQATSEELAFRGYLLQTLAARTGSTLAAVLLTSALFGLAHYDPSGSRMAGMASVAGAAASGLVLADVTRRTGSLSAAIGLHIANNLVALLLVAPEGPLGSLSLYVRPVGAAGEAALILADTALTLLLWGVWVAWWRRTRR